MWMEDEMTETFTSRKKENIGVPLDHARNREGASPEGSTFMPSEADLARVIEKISRLSDAQFAWFTHQMQHLGFSPYDEMSQSQAQQSK